MKYRVVVTQHIRNGYIVEAESKQEAEGKFLNGTYDEELDEVYDNETDIEVSEED